MDTSGPPSIDDVRAASARLGDAVTRTPVITSRTLDHELGAQILLKCEMFQRAGAFKFRGALNAVRSLEESQAARGVAAHSSGNHAAALALAASTRGIPAYLVMPSNAPRAKRAATESYGGSVIECAPTLHDREQTLARVLAETGAHEVHPYDDPHVIAGAGTACLELIDDHPDIGLVIAPVSGGGLLSGTAIAAHGSIPGCRVWGVEPASADDASRSLAAGRLIAEEPGPTIADGLLANLSPRTFGIIAEHAEGIVTVGDDEIIDAMRFLFERCKLVVEPSGAASLAGLRQLRGRLPERVGVILSGGNLDVDELPFRPPDRRP